MTEVPEWTVSSPSLAFATPEQRAFYRHWLARFEDGDFIDIKNNRSYVLVRASAAVTRFVADNDIRQLRQCLEMLVRGYGHLRDRESTGQADGGATFLREILTRWMCDAHLFVGDFDTAWSFRRVVWNTNKFSGLPNAVVNIRSKCIDKSLDGHDLLLLSGRTKLTQFGRDHEDHIAGLATIFLEDFQRDNGLNFVEFFCNQFNFDELGPKDLARLQPFFPDILEFASFKVLYERDRKRASSHGHKVSSDQWHL